MPAAEFVLVDDDEQEIPDMDQYLANSSARVLERKLRNLGDDLFKKVGDLKPQDVKELSWAQKVELSRDRKLAASLELTHLPLKFDVELFGHQLNTLEWMRQREEAELFGVSGGLLCLTMGLGKTLIALTHIMLSKNEVSPTLVICSKTVLHEWEKHADRFYGRRIKALYLHRDFWSDSQLDKLERSDLMSHDLVLTTYEYINKAVELARQEEELSQEARAHFSNDFDGKLKPVSAFFRAPAQLIDSPGVMGLASICCISWSRIFLDESQRIANPDSVTFKNVALLSGRYRWCLTGTPLRNKGVDVWSQLRFCGYTGEDCPQRWNTKTFHDQGLDVLIHKVLTFTPCFLMQKLDYGDTDIVLPSFEENVVSFKLSEKELELYKIAFEITSNRFEALLDKEKDASFASVLAAFVRMRQICIAPFLITPESKRHHSNDEEGDKEIISKAKKQKMTWIYDEDGIGGIKSSKMKALVKLLKGIPDGEKVVIFSTFVAALDLVAKAMDSKLSNMQYLMIDGSVSGTERADIVEQFRKQHEVSCLLMTYKVMHQS